MTRPSPSVTPCQGDVRQFSAGAASGAGPGEGCSARDVPQQNSTPAAASTAATGHQSFGFATPCCKVIMFAKTDKALGERLAMHTWQIVSNKGINALK